MLLFIQIFLNLFSRGKGRDAAHTLYADSSGSISVPESLFYDVLGKISLRGDAAHEDPGKETAGIAAVSPSVWFPGWMEYALSHPIKTSRIYLSLGDKEERTKNQTMKTVGDNIRKLYQRYSALVCTEEIHHPQPEEQSSTRHFLLSCTLEWNPGGHFQHPEERTAQGFAWSMK